MHRKHAFQRQQVIQNREDRFLDLARVSRVADDGKFLLERQADKGVAGGVIHSGHALERRHGNDRKLRHKAFVFFERLRQDEHVAHEMTVPGQFGHDAHRQAIVFVRAAVDILHEDIASLQESQQAVIQFVELVRRKRTVVHAPPDIVFRIGVTHHKFIVRGAGGMLAGIGDEWSAKTSEPSLRKIASSTSASVVRFQYARRRLPTP